MRLGPDTACVLAHPDLLECFRRGDADGFLSLHHGKTTEFFRKRVGASEAEDLTQETFLKLLEANYRPRGKPDEFVGRITSRVNADYSRARRAQALRRHAELQGSSEPMVEVDPDPYEELLSLFHRPNQSLERRILEGAIQEQSVDSIRLELPEPPSDSVWTKALAKIKQVMGDRATQSRHKRA